VATGTDAERLHFLYEVSRRLANSSDLGELLGYATRRARELFDAEGCALLLLDRRRAEFHFPLASQRESQAGGSMPLSEIRFPADRGIAGWVLAHDEAAAVPDVARDSRFYGGVDDLTGRTTRAILCAPLRTRQGSIGVLEILNPAVPTAPAADLEFLEALAGDVAIAYERAALTEQLRGEVLSLRQMCTLAGAGLATLGLAYVLGAAYALLALALPLRELPARPGFSIGLVCLLAGGLLVGAARGWLRLRRRVESS
jgi:GAF domain-containing protein